MIIKLASRACVYTHAFLLVRVCPNTPIIFSKLAAHPQDAF